MESSAQAGGTNVRALPDMLRALRGQRADAVISELTALKKPPASHKDMAATDRLRTEGTANLIAPARQIGAGGSSPSRWSSDTATATGPAGC